MMQASIEKISKGAMMENEWLTPREVASRLRVHVGTLANWRYQGAGPKYTKLSDTPNAPVRYRAADIDEYMRLMERGVAA